ncbi:MAG: potassium transporter TrkH [Pelagibacteraceae bacterium]|nr:potassium transporter TrkH [Pelagibacteraceae bacterium]
MFLPMIVDLLNYSDDWKTFMISGLFTIAIGLSLILIFRNKILKLSVRQAFLLTVLSWIIVAFFSSIPFVLGDTKLSFIDAFFESVSGVTTTGSTVIVDLDNLSRGILLWRSLLQWFGGIGIILLALSVLPMLQIGGMQLFHLESDDPYEKTLPRIGKSGLEIASIYLTLTLACSAMYYFSGMGGFDAIAHSMTTISTGGFSTYNQSFAEFNSNSIEWICLIFMILGSLPFVIFLKSIHGDSKVIFKDDQIKLFFSIIVILVVVMTLWLIVFSNQPLSTSIRESAFNIVSILTGTGYSSTNFNLWGSFGLVVLFVIMFIGGCAGSTTGGIKIFRIKLLFGAGKIQIKKLIQPHGVFVSKFNGKTIKEEAYYSVMGFFFLYIALFSLVAASLAAMEIDFLTAVSASASAISNVGPGLGDIIGPSGNYASLPDLAKIILSLTMVIGRLEIFTFLVLLSLNFWKA